MCVCDIEYCYVYVGGKGERMVSNEVMKELKESL